MSAVPSPTSTRRWPQRLALILLGLVLLLTGGYFGGKAWLLAYLHGPEFRRFFEARLSASFKAEVECAPLHFDGFNVYCEGIKARGYDDSPFARARIDQVRTRFSLRRFFAGAWQLENLTAERLEVQLDGTRLAAPAPVRAVEATPSRAKDSSWLPHRLEIATASVNDLNLTWGDLPGDNGGLHGVTLQAMPAEGGWNLEGKGGELIFAGLPHLNVATLRLRQRRQTLFVNEARFTDANGGAASATGEVRFGELLDLQGHLDGVDLNPLLSGDWRLRLHGRMSGDVRVQTPLPSNGTPTVSGSLTLSEARIEALPVLNAIAAVTRSRDLRQIPLSRASGDFRQEGGRLEVAHLVAESAGRLRLDGGFALQAGQIDGKFEVGLPSGALAWLPGAREQVFTTNRDGYLWAPLQLTGPVESPSEDLSARLVAAAGNTVIDELDKASGDFIETSKDAARRALDFLMPLFK